jgi:hypothetical protein
MELQRELQVDHRGKFVALLDAGRTEAVQHFGRALLRGRDQRRQRTPGRQLRDGGPDEGLARRERLEGAIDLQRLFGPAPARQQPAISVDDTQGRLLGVVGRLEISLGFRRVADHFRDQAGMVVAENREPSIRPRPGRGFESPLAVARPGKGPGGQKGCGQIGRAPLGALLQEIPGRSVLFRLQGPHAKRKLGEAVVRVAGNDPLGRLRSAGPIAVGEQRDEGALKQFGIAGSSFRASR